VRPDLATASAKGRIGLDEVESVERSEIGASQGASGRRMGAVSILPTLRPTIGSVVTRNVSSVS
jgi:hypothetical protein